MTNNTIKFLPSKSDIGKRLDVILSEKIEHLTRSSIKKIIESCNVKINKLIVNSPSKKIKVNDLPDNIIKENNDLTDESNWGVILENWILNRFDSNSKNISKEIDNIYHSILIKSSLKLSKGNKTEAAKILGWGRNTIANKMKSSKD